MPTLASFADFQLMKAMFTFLPAVDSINQQNHYFLWPLALFCQEAHSILLTSLVCNFRRPERLGANRKLLRLFERKTTWTLILEIDENSSYMVLLIHSQLLGSGSLLAAGVTGAMNVWTYFDWTGKLFPFCWNSKLVKAYWQRNAMALTIGFRNLVQGSRGSKVDKHTSRDYYVLSRIRPPY